MFGLSGPKAAELHAKGSGTEQGDFTKIKI